MAIMDSDCDLRPPDLAPTPSDTQARVTLQSKLYNWTMLHSKVLRILRDSPFLSEEEIEKLDDRIQALYERSLPPVSHSGADSAPNPGWHLDSYIFIDNTRFRIFRHNLMPNAPFTSRLAALRRCIDMAKEASPRIAEKFIDDETEQAQEHNQRVVRIIYPEH